MFKIIIKAAFASLFVRKLRTILVILMISMSLWGLMVMQGIYDGMTEQMINNAIRSDSGQVSIYEKDFREKREVSNQIINIEKLETDLKQNKHVETYVKRVISSGLVATAKYSKSAFICGMDLEAEKINSQLDQYMKEGVYSFGKKNKGAILGFKLAQKLKIKVGKKIIVSSQDVNGDIASVSLKVKGIIKTNNLGFDENGVLLHIDKAKEFMGVSGVSQVLIMMNDFSQVKIFKKELEEKHKDITIYDWREVYPALIQTRELMELFSYLSYSIVFFTAAIGIFGVVLVSVLERLREFGILRAIGTKFSQIVAMIFFESFFIGLIGFILGVILGGLTLYYYSIYGLDLRSFSDALDEVGIDAIAYAIIKIEYFVMAFFAVFSATFLSVLIPIKILKRSKPIDVIKE